MEKTSELRTILLLGIPTAFDLTATVLMNIGLLSVTARCCSSAHAMPPLASLFRRIVLEGRKCLYESLVCVPPLYVSMLFTAHVHPQCVPDDARR